MSKPPASPVLQGPQPPSAARAAAVTSARLATDAHDARLMRTAALGREASALRFARGERAELLGRMGIATIRDELYAVPYRYLDFTCVSTVAHAVIGEEVTVVVRVDEVKTKRPKPRLEVVEVSCYDDTAPLIVTYFGQPWVARQIHPGQLVAFSGKMGFSYGFKRMNGPFHDLVAEQGAQALGAPRARMLPVHHVTEGLSQAWARRLASCAVQDYAEVCDFWPARHRARRHLMPLARALRCAHFPADADEAEAARRRLAYDEATLLQIALTVGREARLPGVHPVAHVTEGAFSQALRRAMPFELTADQAAATRDILQDMARPRPMCRLLLGDVGTGKTAVATRALGAVADTGTQAAVMAPTGVLAAQYAHKVGPLLDAAGISWALLTGATPAAERRQTLEGLAAGWICVAFGTHALLGEDVEFASLSLVVIDEQHRFGVRQRHVLREKGRGADLLVMSATPIPRTLALSLYGDLDASYLRERPVAGAGVTTKVISKRERRLAYEAIQQAIDQGRQAYVVCPLVGTRAARDRAGQQDDRAADELSAGGDPSDPRAAQREVEELQRSVFPQARVGLLTGRMPAAEKQRVMEEFRSGQIQVLVSTTVIEVGVDVPNATVMLIEDGERFGLAQLHQLRGRVGRGSHPGTVYVAASASSPTAKQRMRALESTSDGYELALYDLRLRREGDILGARQSGEATLRYVDLSRDEDLLVSARQDSRAMLEADPMLAGLSLRPVRDEVIIRYGDVFKEVGGG